jgi:hypothetical protein
MDMDTGKVICIMQHEAFDSLHAITVHCPEGGRDEDAVILVCSATTRNSIIIISAMTHTILREIKDPALHSPTQVLVNETEYRTEIIAHTRAPTPRYLVFDFDTGRYASMIIANGILVQAETEAVEIVGLK